MAVQFPPLPRPASVPLEAAFARVPTSPRVPLLNLLEPGFISRPIPEPMNPGSKDNSNLALSDEVTEMLAFGSKIDEHNTKVAGALASVTSAKRRHEETVAECGRSEADLAECGGQLKRLRSELAEKEAAHQKKNEQVLIHRRACAELATTLRNQEAIHCTLDAESKKMVSELIEAANAWEQKRNDIARQQKFQVISKYTHMLDVNVELSEHADCASP